MPGLDRAADPKSVEAARSIRSAVDNYSKQLMAAIPIRCVTGVARIDSPVQTCHQV
jgi:hypothetical protein